MKNSKEYNRQYYHEVRKRKENKFFCECCQKDIFFANKYRHIKTNKHKKNELLFNMNDEEKELFKIQLNKIKELESKIKRLNNFE